MLYVDQLDVIVLQWAVVRDEYGPTEFSLSYFAHVIFAHPGKG